MTLSSQMGSIAEAPGGYYLYRSSKAAVNAVTANLASDLKARGVVSVAIHPGWVRTDMGGRDARLSPEESVAALRAIIERLTPADSGRFINYTGDEIPWVGAGHQRDGVGDPCRPRHTGSAVSASRCAAPPRRRVERRALTPSRQGRSDRGCRQSRFPRSPRR